MLDPKGRGLAVPVLGQRERNRALREPEQNRVGQKCVGHVGEE